MAEGVAVVSEMSWRDALDGAERALAAAGVPSPGWTPSCSPRTLLRVPRPGCSRSASSRPIRPRTPVPRAGSPPGDPGAAAVPARTAPMGPVDVAVGPGVFVPRLETELLLEWGLRALVGLTKPLVVDLCTGSGALAAGVAASRPDAEVHAVELDPDALRWAGANLGDRVRLVEGDVTDPELLPELRGRVDLVLANPPYVPEGTPVTARGGRLRPARRGVRRAGRAGGDPPAHRAGHPAAAPRRRAGRRARTTATPSPRPPCCPGTPS